MVRYNGWQKIYVRWRSIRKYINLDNMCLQEEEKKEVINMIYIYKEAFSLRDEIGTCPSIEVGIDVRDKSSLY